MAITPLDEQRLREALELAEQAIGVSDPNPRVGCVLGSDDGRVFGRGSTQRAGQAHAEVMALRDAAAAGCELRGATAWVTLEPCAHHGRTPPCCEALVAAGIARVVVALPDPFAQVSGRGIAHLRAAGVEVVLADPGPVVDAATEINIGFLHRQRHGRPWVRLKSAHTLDGRTALPDGSSRWITGEAARRDGHAWRRRAGAVLSGAGTVLADDPRLDVRLVATELQPLRVVLDSRLRTPPQAAVLAPPGRALLLCTDAAGDLAAESLRAAGAEVRVLPAMGSGLDLRAVLALLAEREINELHVEAGATLTAAWLGAGLVDELLLYVAPALMGPGRPLADLPVLGDLGEMARWRFVEVAPVGDDLRLRLRPVPATGGSVRPVGRLDTFSTGAGTPHSSD